MMPQWVGIDAVFRAADARSEAELKQLHGRKHKTNPRPAAAAQVRPAVHGAANRRRCRCAVCYVAKAAELRPGWGETSTEDGGEA